MSNFDKFFGLALDNPIYTNVLNKNEWKYCDFCEKYHSKEFFFDNIIYCVHCWGWLNSHEFNLEMGIINSKLSIDTINNMIKIVYPLHLESTCINNECIFTKIKKLNDDNKLAKSLMDLLGFTKILKQQTIKSINFKNRNLNINYNDSFIII